MEKRRPFYIRWLGSLKERCENGVTVENIYEHNKRILSKFLPSPLMMPFEIIMGYLAFHAMLFLALLSPIAAQIKGVFGRKGLQLSKRLAKMRTEISLGILAMTAAFHWFSIPAWLNWGVWLRPAINIRPQLNLVHRCKSEPCLGSSEPIQDPQIQEASRKRSYSANFESSYDFGLNLKFKNPVLDHLFDPMDNITAGVDAMSGLREAGQVQSEDSLYMSARSERLSKEMINDEDSMV